MDAVKVERQAQAAARKARSLFTALTTQYTITIKMPEPEVQKLLWFDGGTKRRAGNRGRGKWHQPPRPVLRVKGRARTEAIAAFKARILEDMRAGRPVNMLVALTLAGNAIRAVYALRLSLNGADMRLAPLSPRYLTRKYHHGLDPRTGVATGAMLRTVSTGLVTVRRR
jgi:hypothetical protein